MQFSKNMLFFYKIAPNFVKLILLVSRNYHYASTSHHSFSFLSIDFIKKNMVETRRFELLTPCLQGRCSPNWATPPCEPILYSELILIRNFFHLKIRLILSALLHWRKALVGLSGLEPPTSRLSGVRSNQLSYRPTYESWPLKTEQYRWPKCRPSVTSSILC